MVQSSVTASSRLRRIVVTGGTGAIGSAIVRALCASNSVDGFEVVACYHRNRERAEALQAETGCAIAGLDVRDEAEVELAIGGAGAIWAVVHAAGASKDALLLKQAEGDWNETLAVNSFGAFLVTRACLRALPEGGRLLLLGSRVGERGAAGQGAYASGKAALLALMRCAAIEGAPRGLAINAICPGVVHSAMTAMLGTGRLEVLRQGSVFGEFGNGRDVAGAVRWLLGDEAARITGQVIHCDSRI